MLVAALAATFASSVVHYTDNFLRFDRYSPPDPGLIVRPLIPISWVLFTAAGAFGYVMYRRRRPGIAAFGLAVYAVSGLISPLHYTTLPFASFDTVQHVFIFADFVVGLAVVWFAARLLGHVLVAPAS